MENFIRVVEEEGDEAIELPLEPDNCLLLSTLVAQFPGACGLKYRAENGSMRGCRLSEDRLHPPESFWDGLTFISVFPKGK